MADIFSVSDVSELIISISVSIIKSGSLDSLTADIFSYIHEILPEKKSLLDFLIIFSSFDFKISKPDLLHVTIIPSLLIVITPLDILDNILSLYFLDFETSSNNFAFSKAMATCCVKALSLDSSSSVNFPPFLFKT